MEEGEDHPFGAATSAVHGARGVENYPHGDVCRRIAPSPMGGTVAWVLITNLTILALAGFVGYPEVSR